MQYAELQRGAPAPEFELWGDAREPVHLADFAGRRLLLVFFRKCDTPGCERQLAAVQARLAELCAAGIVAIGVNPDFAEAQQRFGARLGLAFPLLSDEDHQVAEHYGAWGLCQGNAMPYLGPIRTSVLIGCDGRVEGAWYDVAPERAADVVLEFIRSVPQD